MGLIVGIEAFSLKTNAAMPENEPVVAANTSNTVVVQPSPLLLAKSEKRKTKKSKTGRPHLKRRVKYAEKLHFGNEDTAELIGEYADEEEEKRKRRCQEQKILNQLRAKYSHNPSRRPT